MAGQNLPEAPEELTVEALTRRLKGLRTQDSVDTPSISSRNNVEQNRPEVKFRTTEVHRQESGGTTTVMADIHSPANRDEGSRLMVESEVRKKVSIADPDSFVPSTEEESDQKKKNKRSKKTKKERKPETSEEINVVDNGLIELEKKIQQEYIKVPERKSEREVENEIGLSPSPHEAKTKIKKKSLSFKRSNSSKPALDLDTMWRQEEEKALGLVKGFSPKPEFQPRSITIQTSDGNSSPTSENLSDEETYL